MTYIDFGDNLGYAKVNLWMIYARADQAEFEIIESDNAIKAVITGFEASFSSEYARVRETIFTVSGHAEVLIKNITISVEIKMDALAANDTNSTGRLIPGISIGEIYMYVDPAQVVFKFSGSVIAESIDLFSPAFLEYLIKQTELSIKS